MRYIWLVIALILGACGANAGSTTNLETPTIQSPSSSVITPTAIFSRELGMGGFPALTLEQIGLIPPNTRVNVSTASLQDGWVYSIYDANGSYENARESQLAFAPDITPGAPTPTAGFADLWRQGNVYAITLVDVGNIPAGTRVYISGGHYGEGEWLYMVSNAELGLSGEVTESQLEVVEVQAFDVITEVPTESQ